MENLRIERELLENRKRDALSEEKRGRRPKNALRSYEITIPENIPNRISVPFGLVLERILEYYWHIFAESKNNVYPAQSNSKSPLKFRKALSKLVDSYCGDFERFRNEWYSGHFSSADDAFKLEKVRCITNAFKKISETILNGPIKYSGNSQENPSKLKDWLIFSVLQENKQKLYSTPEAMIKSEGSLFMPASLWFEISNSSIWFKDSIIVEWAQLSEFFSRNSDNEKCKKYTTAEIIPLLLPHEYERNTKIARLEFEKAIHSTGLKCVWTGRALSETDLHVDHLLPWSRLHCNALWNLFPAYRLVNIRKSDKVPSLDCLEKNSNRIFSIWSMLEESNSAIFRREAETTLTGSPLPAVKWQTPLFDRLIETIESLALQSGAQRWDP